MLRRLDVRVPDPVRQTRLTIEGQPRARIDWLDYGRFLSACAVLTFHYLVFGPQRSVTAPVSAPAFLSMIAPYGYLGVDFFFIVSGFVITMSLEGRTSTGFAAARLVRLYPGFIACMTLTAIVLAVAGWRVSFPQWLANTTMLANVLGFANMDGVYWSLYFEIFFYAAVWLILLVGARKHFEKVVLAWLALQVLSFLTYRVPFFSGYFSLFAAGCIFSFARKDGWNAVRLLAILVALALSMAQATSRQDLIMHEHGPVSAMATVGFFAVFALFHHFEPRLPLARWIGALTYPLYLLHASIGYVLLQFLPMPVVIAIVLGLAAAVAEFVERRPQALWRSLASRLCETIGSYGNAAMSGLTNPRLASTENSRPGE